MKRVVRNFRLLGTSGELAGKWLETMALARKNGAPPPALPWEDVERHPEDYFLSPKFIDVEDGAWKALTLEIAQRYQGILKREGIETQIV